MHFFIIACASIFTYANSLRNGFVWDDILLVVHNDFIKGFRLFPEVFRRPLFYLTNPQYLYYRPLQTIFNAFDYWVWGLHPFGFHLTNLILHILVACLLYKLAMLLSRDRMAALLTAVLFAVHPAQGFAVNYVSGRADILLALFSLSSLYVFLTAQGRHGSCALSVFFFALALLSKEAALVLPLCVIFAHETYAKMESSVAGQALLRARLWYAAFLIIGVFYLVLRKKVFGLGADILPMQEGRMVAPGTFLFTFAVALAGYLKMLFMPVGLHMLATVPVSEAAAAGRAAFFFAAALATGVFSAVILWRVSKGVFLGLGFFLIWLLPAASLAFRNPEYSIQGLAVTEVHWLYIPAAGICLAAIFILRGMSRKKALARALGAGSVFCVILLSVLTAKENAYWKNNLTFFTHTLKYVTRSPTVYRNLAWVYLNKHDINEALALYNKALELRLQQRQRAVLYKDIAYAYLLDGDTRKAIASSLEALRSDPEYAEARVQLGLAYAKDDPARAAQELLRVLESDPWNAAAFNYCAERSRGDAGLKAALLDRYLGLPADTKGFDSYRIRRALGILYLYSGEHDKAFALLEAGLRANPYDVTLTKALGVCYAQTGQASKAERTFRRAVLLNPFDKESARNLALFYESQGRQKEADRLIQRSAERNLYY